MASILNINLGKKMSNTFLQNHSLRSFKLIFFSVKKIRENMIHHKQDLESKFGHFIAILP